MDERELVQWMKERGYEQRGNEWHKVGRVAQNPQRERSVVDEPVGTDEGKVADQKRRVVRIKSYRLRLVDPRNLFDKHFTDALVEACILVDDSAEWAEVIVEQEQVRNPAWERTEITISDS